MNDRRTLIRVLHVDDDPDLLSVTAELLEREDERIEVVTETSVDGALERLVETEVDCIVADYDMPGQTGIDFLEHVREWYENLPFILFTGHGSEEIASQAISAGVSDYLQKQGGTEQYAILSNRIVNLVDKQQAERALEWSENRYRRLVECAPVPILIYSATGDVVEANPAALCFLESENKSEVLGKNVKDFTHPDERSMIDDRLQRLTDDRQALPQHEHRIVALNGEVKHTIAASAPVQYDGAPAIQTIALDITERRDRERKLEQLQERTQQLMGPPTKAETAQVAVETAHDVLDAPLSGFHLQSSDGTRLEPIATVETVEEELGRRPVYDRNDETDPIAEVVWETFESGEPLYIDDTADDDRLAGVTAARSAIIHPLADHGVFIVSATTPAAFDQTDRTLVELLATALTVALDRAERETLLREREETLARQNERLDTFTSVVSHDLRNPLTVAEGRIELAMETGDREHLETASNAIERMQTMIEDLLTLAREGETGLSPEPVGLADMVVDCWETIETDTASLNIETNRQIEADPGCLRQLLSNVLKNAIDHTPGDVTVTVGDLADGFYVEDTGPGIAADERDVVFETGYTTAEDGTGFGLSIVEQMATIHGWDLDLTTAQDGGTRVEITGVEDPPA
ncbi:MAG: response regulator [Halobacteriales archaeon]